jgi:hypothetical protein
VLDWVWTGPPVATSFLCCSNNVTDCDGTDADIDGSSVEAKLYRSLEPSTEAPVERRFRR